MSQQASCASEALVGAAGTVSIGEHMVVPPISELPIERLVFSLSPIGRTMSRRSRVHVWSYLTRREVEVKDGSTAAGLVDSSESIIDAICSQTRGSFSIS
jgi:hypothetical protein